LIIALVSVTKTASSRFNSLMTAVRSDVFGVGFGVTVDWSTVVSMALDEEGLGEDAGRDAMAVVNCSTTVLMSVFNSLISFLIDKMSLA